MARIRHTLPLLLLACALFLRALVPAGWMPAESGGLFSIEPCPAASPQLVMHMDDNGHMPGDHGSSHGKQHSDGCFSALLIGFAPVDQPASFMPRAALTETPATFSASHFLARGPPALPPPSTGPPAIA